MEHWLCRCTCRSSLYKHYTLSFLHCVCPCVPRVRPWSCPDDSAGTTGSMTTAILDVCVCQGCNSILLWNRVKWQKGNSICCCCFLSRLPIRLLALTPCPLCSDSTNGQLFYCLLSCLQSLSLSAEIPAEHHLFLSRNNSLRKWDFCTSVYCLESLFT